MTEAKKETFTGSCLCGEVEFEYQSPSLWCAHCHCSLCRRAHGAAFVTWVGVLETRFRLIKQLSLRWYQSSGKAERGFCGDCGSTMFFRSRRWPDEIHIARANLEGELDIKPDSHVTFGSPEVSWFRFTDDLPRRESDSG